MVGYPLVTVASENPLQVGKLGVDTIVDGMTQVAYQDAFVSLPNASMGQYYCYSNTKVDSQISDTHFLSV